jgi:hypothetical protein
LFILIQNYTEEKCSALLQPKHKQQNETRVLASRWFSSIKSKSCELIMDLHTEKASSSLIVDDGKIHG